MYSFTATLWMHDGDAAWHFVTLPNDVSDEIDFRTAGQRHGFGSVRVRVTVGTTTWATSIFPDKRSESYVLPLKKPVRTAEGLEAGDDVAISLDVIE